MKTKRIIKDLIFVLAGNGLLALSVALFILPHDILSGGVAGIAVALHPLLHLDTTLIINAMVLGMFVLGCLFLGRSFALKTVISSRSLSDDADGFHVPVPQLQLNELLAALYGGLLAGAGIGLVMRTAPVPGGMDIPPLILHRYTGIKVSTLVMVTDALTYCWIVCLWAGSGAGRIVSVVGRLPWGIDKILTFGWAAPRPCRSFPIRRCRSTIGFIPNWIAGRRCCRPGRVHSDRADGDPGPCWKRKNIQAAGAGS